MKKATPEENKTLTAYRVPDDAVAFSKDQWEVVSWQLGKAMDLVDDWKARALGAGKEKDEALNALNRLVHQHFLRNEGTKDDPFIAGYIAWEAEALRVLGKHGLVKVFDDDGGRWVMAEAVCDPLVDFESEVKP